MNKLNGLKPQKVFEYFEKISSIPRGSGDTKKIREFCVEFAKEHNLEYYQDSSNNVIIYKNATKGYEDSPAVIRTKGCAFCLNKITVNVNIKTVFFKIFIYSFIFLTHHIEMSLKNNGR